jgi:hypothetical protein
MPVPASTEAVPPWAILELEPDVPARVNKVPPETIQVEQLMSPVALSAIGPVAETARVPDASGKVYVRAAVRSLFVIVPSKVAAPVAAAESTILSSVAEALRTVSVPVSILLPDTLKLPVPVLMFTAVAPVLLPIVIVLALAPVPILTAPVVPLSTVTAPVVPEVTVKALAAAELRAVEPVEVSVVVPVPVRVEAPEATAKRVLPEVIKLKAELMLSRFQISQ